MAKLKAGEPETVEAAIQFVDTSPQFFRSGYIEENILRHLKHVRLTEQQKERLVRVILGCIHSGGRRRFVSCAKLAGSLHDQRIRDGAMGRVEDTDPEVRRRARRILDFCD